MVGENFDNVWSQVTPQQSQNKNVQRWRVYFTRHPNATFRFHEYLMEGTSRDEMWKEMNPPSQLPQPMRNLGILLSNDLIKWHKNIFMKMGKFFQVSSGCFFFFFFNWLSFFQTNVLLLWWNYGWIELDLFFWLEFLLSLMCKVSVSWRPIKAIKKIQIKNSTLYIFKFINI